MRLSAKCKLEFNTIQKLKRLPLGTNIRLKCNLESYRITQEGAVNFFGIHYSWEELSKIMVEESNRYGIKPAFYIECNLAQAIKLLNYYDNH